MLDKERGPEDHVDMNIVDSDEALGNVTHSIVVCTLFAAQIWVWKIAPSPLKGFDST